MLAMADEAEHRLHEDQSMLRGHLRLFSTIDLGQFMVTRLISSFLQVNPDVTAELGYNNRPLHMIQEGCDAGIIVGDIADDSVVARPAGIVSRCLVAAPSLVKTRPPVKEPSDLKSWPWLIISSPQFDGTNKFTLYSSDRSEYSLQVSPVFITEGASSLREAARAGLGVVAISYWLIREDILSGRLIRVLPQWSAKALSCHIVYPAQRMLPARVRAFIDFATKYMTTELRSSKVS
jgi:DNA-binding transcriptional LysR family regulator